MGDESIKLDGFEKTLPNSNLSIAVKQRKDPAMSNHSPPLRSTVSLYTKTNLTTSKNDDASKTKSTEVI